MFYLWMILLAVLNCFWLITVLFGLPGNWLIILSALLVEWRWPHTFSIYTLIAVIVLALLGEIIELLGGLAGARKAGAGFRGSLGALGGGLLGALVGTALFPVPLFGTLLGGCVGAGIGAWGLELSSGKTRENLTRLGVNAGIGYLIGKTAKFVCGVIMWVILTIAAFWP